MPRRSLAKAGRPRNSRYSSPERFRGCLYRCYTYAYRNGNSNDYTCSHAYSYCGAYSYSCVYAHRNGYSYSHTGCYRDAYGYCVAEVRA